MLQSAKLDFIGLNHHYIAIYTKGCLVRVLALPNLMSQEKRLCTSPDSKMEPPHQT